MAALRFRLGPSVAREQHEAQRDVLLPDAIGDGAARLGLAGEIFFSARTNEPPLERRLRLLALPDMGGSSAGAAAACHGDRGRELRIHGEEASAPGPVLPRRRRCLREGRRGGERRRYPQPPLRDVRSHMAAESASTGESPEAEPAPVPVHAQPPRSDLYALSDSETPT